MRTFALGINSRSQYPQAVLRFARWLRHNRVDVLHAHLFEASFGSVSSPRGSRLSTQGLYLPSLSRGSLASPALAVRGRSLHGADTRRFDRRPLTNGRNIRQRKRMPSRGQGHRTWATPHGFHPARADPHAVRSELGLDGKTILARSRSTSGSRTLMRWCRRSRQSRPRGATSISLCSVSAILLDWRLLSGGWPRGARYCAGSS